uniref:Uncharacterized protein n=1 Tax=Cacopsylla melanoneura TaxID=428564 RepID=A0A8D8YE19_9HEMI
MFFFSLNRRFIFKVNNCLGSVNATVKRIPQVLALPLIKLFILIIINDNNKNNIVLQNTTYEKALDNMRKHWNHSVYETVMGRESIFNLSPKITVPQSSVNFKSIGPVKVPQK